MTAKPSRANDAVPTPPEPGETDVAYPPRFRRLKRLSLLFVIVVVALLALRLGWGYVAQRRFDQEIAAAPARGEKILPADFWPAEPVPTSENAAPLYTAAGISWTPALQEWE